MKVSREEAAANRERIVDVAGHLFREMGFDGISVAELMKAAGLTHGGFYGHFKSKDHLAEEASGRAIESSAERWAQMARESGDDALGVIVKAYLSQAHIASPDTGCVFAALGSDAARQGKSVQRAFARGCELLVGVLSQVISGRSESEKRRNSITVFSEMIGAVVLARSIAEPRLAKEILQTVSADLMERHRGR